MVTICLKCLTKVLKYPINYTVIIGRIAPAQWFFFKPERADWSFTFAPEEFISKGCFLLGKVQKCLMNCFKNRKNEIPSDKTGEKYYQLKWYATFKFDPSLTNKIGFLPVVEKQDSVCVLLLLIKFKNASYFIRPIFYHSAMKSNVFYKNLIGYRVGIVLNN